MSENIKAQVLTNTEELKISQFVNATTPGNVGVCLSGGGSRALTSGMGQLRALNYLKTKEGKSLLELTKALSTVSGGSWVGSTFMFVNSNVDDDSYLNKYVENPSKLTPKAKTGSLPEEVLNILPANNIGLQITQKFNIVSLALDLIKYYHSGKIDASMMWQTIVGNQILKPYGLFTTDSNGAPICTYTYDSSTKNDIINNNPSLKDKQFALITNTHDMSKKRPAFLICNAAMFVRVDGEHFEYLAPLQSTPLYTGILSSSSGVDANNLVAGGGGVTSCAFNSMLANVEQANVAVYQNRQWSLADIIGISSAFFAEMLQNKIKDWQQNPSTFVADVQNSDIANVADSEASEHESIFGKLRDKISQDFELAKKDAEADFEKFLKSAEIDSDKILSALDALKDLIPKYNYWPVKDMKPDSNIKPTRFADAGNLENTGISALLRYSDIDKVISFVNSDTALGFSSHYFVDASKKNIPNTNVIVDSQIPPLFGYQAYDKDKGYVLYAGAAKVQDPVFKYNQVFKSEMFPVFLQQLATSAGANLNTNSAIVNMKLDVVDNSWFGISNRGSIQLVLVYTNRVRSWYNLLNSDVQKVLGKFDDPKSYGSFPHYSTGLKTQLTAEEINLLSSLTAWTVANPNTAQTFVDLYK